MDGLLRLASARIVRALEGGGEVGGLIWRVWRAFEMSLRLFSFSSVVILFSFSFFFGRRDGGLLVVVFGFITFS